MRIPTLLAALLCGTTLFAASPRVLSVTPNSGPTSGGTLVTITGSDFISTCTPQPVCEPVPPVAYFGSMPAVTELVNDSTILAKAPAHLPGTVSVGVRHSGGAGSKPEAFTYTGEVPSMLVRLLLPTFTGPVRGAAGSDFRTELRATVSGRNVAPLGIYGLLHPCTAPVECPDPSGINTWAQVTHGDDLDPIEVAYGGNPGRFIYVRADHLESLTMNLRVFDASRDAANFGTEMPIVSSREFHKGAIALLGVPTDARFRNALRIYNASPLATVVEVRIGDRAPMEVAVPGAPNLFEPGYAVFTDFPTGLGQVPVRLEQPMAPVGADLRADLWAFMTVTNNDTQLITTITPSPQF